MLDVGTQLRDYLEVTAPAVELEDIVMAPVGDGPVRPFRPRPSVRPTQGWVAAAAAAIVVLLFVGGGAAWLLGSDRPGDPASPTTVTPTTVAPTTVAPTTVAPTTLAATTTVPVSGSEDALAIAAAYFAAYNEGDVDAVYALFEPDATFVDNFGAQDRAAWEQLLVWNAAQGTALSPPNCLVGEEVAGVSVKLVCPHGNLDAVVQAVEGSPVPINLTLLVSPDGIIEWTSIFGDPDFNEVSDPFQSWMTANHPDFAAAVDFGSWDSHEEAEQNGILRAQYAAQWATFLEANDCAYDDGC